MKSIVHSVLRPLASVLCLLSLVLPSYPITATKEYVDRQDKKKLDLPAVTIPTNFVPVTIGEGRVAWKLMQGGGGGGGSLGKVTQLQDESGNWHNVSSAWNEVTHEYDLVIDPNVAPHEEMTVQQEMERAVTAETKLFETNQWETAQRIAGDYALQTQIDSLSSLGRFVSTLDTTTGKPSSEPLADPFIFQGGDYYIVGKVDDSTSPTNFIPAGPVYRHGVAFTNIAPDEVYVNDVYRYTDDGSWVHVVMKGASVTWASLVGSPLDSTNFIVGVHHVTTQTVTKAYVEGLGIQSCDTNAVQYIIDRNVITNNLASYTLAQSKVANPAETIPAGYALVRGVSNITEWVQLPATNIVGFLGYIRDLDGNAYRVIAETNPAGSIVASVEQTPTPVTVITIDEEYARATNAEYQIALAATNYTDLAYIASTNYAAGATNALTAALLPLILERATTNELIAATNDLAGVLLPLILERATTNDLIAATNALDIAHLAALAATAQSATNYTDIATNALDIAHQSKMSQLSQAATNYTDSATNTLDTALRAALADEATARADADAANLAALTATSAVFRAAIADEATARADADTANLAALTATSAVLRAAIADEATARQTADTANLAALTATSAVLKAEILSASTAATNYTDAAKTALNGRVDTEIADRQAADALLIPLEQKGAVDGVAPLDAQKIIPAIHMPDVVFDVLEYADKVAFPLVGRTNAIYVARDNNKIYRYDLTSEYIEIGSPGTTNYVELINKPKIAGVTLQGDKSLDDLGIQPKLPDVIRDYYLHANENTGVIEWKAVTGGGGTGNYPDLTNKPQIGGHTLLGGNQTAASLGLQTNIVVDATVANKVLKNDGSTLFWGSGGGGGSDDCIPITKTVSSATDIKNLFEKAFDKSWDDIPQNSSMIVYATGLPYADNTFPNSEGYCILRYRTYRYAYIEFVCPTVIKNGTKFNKMQNGTWKGWTDPPLPIYNINSPTSYMDLFNKMGYVYGMDGFTASGIATGLNIDPAKGDYFPHPNCYVTVSSLNNACYRIQASGFNQIGVLWERREESGLWRPWTRIDGNVSQKTIWGDYNDCDSIFLEAFCTTNSQPDKATITGYAYNLNTAIFPETTGFMTMRQVDSNNKQIEFRSTNPDTPVKYNTKTNGVWTGWKSSDPLQTTALILNGGPEQITGPMVIPNGYGTAGQVLVSNGSSTAPGWGDIFDIIYPVGSIYISVGSTIPTAFTQGGRTWEKLSDGQFLMNTTGTTGVSGGSNSRTLTTANMPSHTHGPGTLNLTGEVGRNGGSGLMTDGSYSSGVFKSGGSRSYGPAADVSGTYYMIKFQASGNWSGATASVGSGTAFDNRPSYLSVSMWKRTN